MQVAEPIPQNVITTIRQAFHQRCSKYPEIVLEPLDLARFSKDDVWVGRFYRHSYSEIDKTIDLIWNTFKWRKEMDVAHISENNIKMEIIYKGIAYPHNRDLEEIVSFAAFSFVDFSSWIRAWRECLFTALLQPFIYLGSLLFIIAVRKHIRTAYTFEEMSRGVLYWMERMDREEQGNPITIFFDLDGVSYVNVDFDLIEFLHALVENYYPDFLHLVLLWEIPFIVNAAYKVIKSWMSKRIVNKVRFVNKQNIGDFIAKDQLAIAWGGLDSYEFEFVSDVGKKTQKNLAVGSVVENLVQKPRSGKKSLMSQISSCAST